MIETSGFFFNINTVFGKLPFVCFGVTDANRDYLIRRAGDALAPGGRMPLPGKPEAVISEGLARNKKVKVGDIIASPLDTGTFVPAPAKIKLVGILNGPTWMAFTSSRFTDENLPQVPRSLLVTTKDAAKQRAFGDVLFNSLDKVQVGGAVIQQPGGHAADVAGVDVPDHAFGQRHGHLRGRAHGGDAVQHLLHAAHQRVRRAGGHRPAAQHPGLARRLRDGHPDDPGLAGRRRNQLRCPQRHEGSVFEPRGMLIDPGDPLSYLNTLPIPVFITLFAVATISYRLSHLDPVTIIERR